MQTTIAFATGNPAKLQQFANLLGPLGITIISAADCVPGITVRETGPTAVANAAKKAIVYSAALRGTQYRDLPVLGVDNALYLEGLATDKQPGTHVRRLRIHQMGAGLGGRPTDVNLLKHYRKIIQNQIRQTPGADTTVGGYWEYGLALAMPDGELHVDTITSARRFTPHAGRTVTPGQPLNSVQLDPRTGRHLSDLSSAEIADFWRDTIGSQITAFATQHLSDGGTH